MSSVSLRQEAVPRVSARGRPPDLGSKLLARDGLVLLYGTTPPRLDTPRELIVDTAGKLADRVQRLPLDGIVVYDLQDENGRTHLPRPFTFAPKVDSRSYSVLLGEFTGRAAICYKCIGLMREPEWQEWLTETAGDYRIQLLSLVGRPSSRGAPYPMSLARAFQIAATHHARFTLGGVTIAERQDGMRSESHRMINKGEMGCRFFVSQTVYEPSSTVRLLAGYAHECRQRGVPPKRIVLSFAPCGRSKTMGFMKWLGIAIPPQVEESILTAPAPLTKSIEICCSNLRQILSGISAGFPPLGFCAESVSIHKDEIDASIDLFHALREVLDEYGREGANCLPVAI